MIQSFETQLEKSLPDLWRYAWSLTRDRSVADDLVQDCIERALRKRLLWIPGRPLKPWLTKILLNLYRDRLRSESRRQTVTLDQISNVAELSASPEERLKAKEIWKSLDKLPPEQRQALLAVVAAGLSYEEVASALGIPRGTLMSRISRARAKLKADMDASAAPKIRSVK
ncbi:RNA polymerase sigma factor [Roseibium sp. SCP14]|uniref:RNA polymerase sigma factor n=1 Tax=Roseibium sp. SCP14 TaxID=3141375 RepID=UPI003339E5B2